MMIIAHRGATEDALENSWSAFAKAIEIGCSRIELDVQLTKDHVPIVIHDYSLNMTCTQKGIIANLRYDEIRDIRLKNGEPIPLFSDILEQLAPKIEINAELKGSKGMIGDIVGEMVSKSPNKDQIIISSFAEKPLLHLKKNFPHLKRAVLWGYDTLHSHPLYFFNPNWFLKNCDTNVFHPEASLLSSKVVNKLKRKDLLVYPWVPMKGEDGPNPDKLWSKMLHFKVNGLCTNKPTRLKEFLLNKENRDA